MKILVLSFLSLLVFWIAPVKAEYVQSNALDYIEEAFYAAEEDLSARYSFRPLVSKNLLNSRSCKVANVREVLNLFDEAIDFYYGYFGDERLPVVEAKNDIKGLLAVKSQLSLCTYENGEMDSYIVLDGNQNSVFQIHYIRY